MDFACIVALQRGVLIHATSDALDYYLAMLTETVLNHAHLS